MAKIKTQLDDIRKIIEKNQQTNKERLNNINKEIKFLEDETLPLEKGKWYLEHNENYNTLIEARNILQEKVDEEDYVILKNQSRVTLNQLQYLDFNYCEKYTPVTGEVFHGFVMLKTNETDDEDDDEDDDMFG